jgi:glucose 1-dehydrogenase
MTEPVSHHAAQDLSVTDVPITGSQPLLGRCALVTGATTGLGRAIAERLAIAGATVVVNYRGAHQPDAEQLVRELEAHGGAAIALNADVSKEEEVVAMFAAATHRVGPIDLLVNNAGVEEKVDLIDMSLDQWNKVIGTNLTGVFLCCREAAKALRAAAKPGVIVNVSSVHQRIPWPGYAHYCASKGGLKLLTGTLARELAGDRIRVVNVAPGAIETPINNDVRSDPAQYEQLLGQIPMERVGTPLEIANAVAWLGSDQASYVTGETLFIDGGMSLYNDVI